MRDLYVEFPLSRVTLPNKRDFRGIGENKEVHKEKPSRNKVKGQ